MENSETVAQGGRRDKGKGVQRSEEGSVASSRSSHPLPIVPQCPSHPLLPNLSASPLALGSDRLTHYGHTSLCSLSSLLFFLSSLSPSFTLSVVLILTYTLSFTAVLPPFSPFSLFTFFPFIPCPYCSSSLLPFSLFCYYALFLSFLLIHFTPHSCLNTSVLSSNVQSFFFLHSSLLYLRYTFLHSSYPSLHLPFLSYLSFPT